MIRYQQTEHEEMLILAPNQSSNWPANRAIIICFAGFVGFIALSFALLGAWFIIPFAGLEVLLLAIGMYYTCWKLNAKQVLKVHAQSITLEKGIYFPKRTWQWQAHSTSAIKLNDRYRLGPPKILLRHLNEKVEIGEFLNKRDKVKLVKYLQELNIPCLEHKN